MNYIEFEKSVKDILPQDTIRDIRALYVTPMNLDSFKQFILNF